MKNPQLKKAYAVEEYTPEMIQELVKCKSDPVHFIQNYVKVQHPVKGNIPFHLFDYQIRFIRHMQENRFTVTLQPRQVGKCLHNGTNIKTILRPSGIKKLILRFLDRKTYDNLFQDT